MADHFSNLLTQLTTEFSSKQLLLNEQEKKLEAERQSLEHEWQTMTKVVCSDNDIVYLNVGGRLFATKRASLRLIPGSVLELMFSGRWEDRVERDKDGHVFLDYDPSLFEVILRYLVAVRSYGQAAEHLELRPIPCYLEDEFRLMLRHLGLDEIIQPSISFKWSEARKTPTVKLEDNATKAVSDGGGNLRHHVLSQDMFHGGLYKFYVTIESLEEWVMLGFIREDVHLQVSDDAYKHESTFGFGSNGEVFVKGVESSKRGYPGRSFQTGDHLTIILDCRYSTMTLVAPIGDEMLEYKVPIVSGQKWRLVMATYFGTSVIHVTTKRHVT